MIKNQKTLLLSVSIRGKLTVPDNVGTPVTAWLWNFGDGTTATGPVANHQYPPGWGSVNVTLTGLANNGGECCFLKIFNNMSLYPCDTGVSLARQTISLGNPVIIVLDQNAPNPFAESTVISYHIPSYFDQAQLIFTTADGKEIKG